MIDCHKLNRREAAFLASHALGLSAKMNWSQLKEGEHIVQFYEDESVFLELLSCFIEAGLRNDDRILAIATADHRKCLEQQLAADGFNVRALAESGQYLFLDASEALSRFMLNGKLDENSFDQYLNPLIENMVRGGQKLRAFGEMVALLLGAGNLETALALEKLWNRCLARHSFSLFCAYPSGCLPTHFKEKFLAQICREHSSVIATDQAA